jgi:Dynein heavy chain, N-terminal region 2
VRSSVHTSSSAAPTTVCTAVRHELSHSHATATTHTAAAAAGDDSYTQQLPLEGKRFASVDKHWRSTMTAAAAGGGAPCVKFCNSPKLLEKLRESARLLETVQKGLSDYLETKRAGFSRFYFLSNDELLEILSQTKDPLAVQPHLKKVSLSLLCTAAVVVIAVHVCAHTGLW